jgi:hypothetical protein
MNLDPDNPEMDPIDDEPVDPESEPIKAKARRGGAVQGGVLGAAMLAVGDILEPDKTVIEIEQAKDDPLDDEPFELDFGDLPPLS